MDTTKPSGSPLLRVLRQLVIAGLVLLTPAALFHVVENFRGKRAWNQYRKDAEARGLKLNFADHIPKPIPDSENGANTPFIQSWFPLPRLEGTNQWPDLFGKANGELATRKDALKGPGAKDARAFTDLVDWQQAFSYVESSGDEKTPKPDRPTRAIELDPKEQAAAAAVVLDKLKPYQPALAELHAMKGRDQVRYPIAYNLDEPFSILLPHLAKIKGIIQESSLQASANLAAGQTNQAFETVRLMLWFCDSLDEEMFLISQLVRIAGQQITTQPIWEGLARHQWSEAQLKEMQERLLRANFISALDSSMAVERAGGMTAIEWVRKQRRRENALSIFEFVNPQGGSPIPSGLATKSLLGWLIPNGWFHFEMANFGRLMDQARQDAWDTQTRLLHARTLDHNNQQLAKQFARGPVDIIWNHYLFARLLLPALENASKKFALAQATAHQAALACAMERYYLAQGKYPDALTELVPKFIAKIPNEVVSTNAMRYQPTAQGYALYSVGWDGKDDGGEFLLAAKSGEPEKGDWVWRNAP